MTYFVRYLLISVAVWFSLQTVSSTIVEETDGPGDVSEERITSFKGLWKEMKLKCESGFKAECVPCEKNRYKPRKGNHKRCIDCRPGFSTLSTGSKIGKDCIKHCREGQFYNKADGVMACQSCPPNTYMDVRSLEFECKPCPTGMITESDGAQSIDSCFLNCPAGQSPNDEGTECVPCPDGFYKDTEGSALCKECPLARPSTLEDGADSKDKCAKVCDAGKEYNATSNACDVCEKNFYKAGATSSRQRCIPCEPNTVAKRKASVVCEVECGPGFEPSRQGCSQCPWGKYKIRTGNSPCDSCTSETGPNKITLSRGTPDRTMCLRLKNECFFNLLPDLEAYYETLRAYPFNNDDDIISVLLGTCQTASIKDVINKVVGDFLTCPDLEQIILPDLKIAKHEVQMTLLKNVAKYAMENGGDYCDYLKCVGPHAEEISKCRREMKDDVSGPVPFCNDKRRTSASCVTLNLVNCPPLQFHPSVTQLDLSGLTVREIAEKGNMLKICGESDAADETGPGGNTGQSQPSTTRGTPPPPPPPTTTPSGGTDDRKSCDYAGGTYAAGVSFPASDGCNTCSCNNGAIMCTLAFCLPNSQSQSSTTRGPPPPSTTTTSGIIADPYENCARQFAPFTDADYLSRIVFGCDMDALEKIWSVMSCFTNTGYSERFLLEYFFLFQMLQPVPTAEMTMDGLNALLTMNCGDIPTPPPSTTPTQPSADAYTNCTMRLWFYMESMTAFLSDPSLFCIEDTKRDLLDILKCVDNSGHFDTFVAEYGMYLTLLIPTVDSTDMTMLTMKDALDQLCAEDPVTSPPPPSTQPTTTTTTTPTPTTEVYHKCSMMLSPYMDLEFAFVSNIVLLCEEETKNEMLDILKCFDDTGHFDVLLRDYGSVLTMLQLYMTTTRMTMLTIEDALNSLCEVREGECPAVDKGSVSICLHVCSRDGECVDESMKCCPSSCGNTCQSPIGTVGYCKDSFEKVMSTMSGNICDIMDDIIGAIGCFLEGDHVSTLTDLYGSFLSSMGISISGDLTMETVRAGFDATCNPDANSYEACVQQLMGVLGPLQSGSSYCELLTPLDEAFNCFRDNTDYLGRFLISDHFTSLVAMLAPGSIIGDIEGLMSTLYFTCSATGLPDGLF